MNVMKMFTIENKITVVILGCLLTPAVWAASETRNLALHRKLAYIPTPNHYLLSHPRDPYILTDGIIGKCLWYKTYSGKTVGWGGAKRIEITIDLGQMYNVGYVNLYTVGCGKPDVEYPEYVIAASSTDGVQYTFAGYASSDDWNFEANDITPRTLKLRVEQKARYVKLYVRPIGYYFLTDEIEVIESNNSQLKSFPADYLSKDELFELVERARQLQREMKILKTRINESMDAKEPLQSEVNRVETVITGLASKINLDKVSEAESQFSVFRRKLLSAQYNTDWFLYPVDPMDILHHGDIPAQIPKDTLISLYQWRDEHDVAAFNLVNCTPYPITFEMNLSPLRFQDRIIDSNGIFELRRAVFIWMQNAGLVADPLVLQNTKPFSVAAGETVQLWLETYTEGLEAGDYAAALAISASGDNISKKQDTVPINLEVVNRTFPAKVPFASCNWDHVTVSDRFTSKKPELVKYAIRDLENHDINVCVIRFDNVFDNTKRVFSWQKLSNEIVLRSKGNPLILFQLGWQCYLDNGFGALRTARWESNFKSFLAQFRAFMEEKGFDYNSYALYPYDESIGDDFIYVAKIIRDFDPRLKIYANKRFESETQFRNTKDLIDIWCPHLPEVIANKDIFARHKNSGNFDAIWCYYANLPKCYFFSPEQTTIGKLWRGGPNCTAFRTMPIVAASLGMTGAGFWVYQDQDKAGWTEDTMGSYGVIYNGAANPDKDCIPELIVPSKRWQQWREGIEDAVCLSGHQDLLDEFIQKPASQLRSDYLISLRKRADKEANR